MAINLSKGGRISLTKTAKKGGEAVNVAFAGANWSALENGQAVDLDLSILYYDEDKNVVDKVYFSQLSSTDGSGKHSGDDRVGDEDGDDGLDNEIIKIDFSKVRPNVKSLVVVLNSYSGQDFGVIPNIGLRIYTNESGKADDVSNILATYVLSNNKEYAGNKAIILGHFYKKDLEWKFAADGEGTTEKDLGKISTGIAVSVL